MGALRGFSALSVSSSIGACLILGGAWPSCVGG